jgi:hypothetical protein
MRTTVRHLVWRIDGFCARLNSGLAAVALVLAALVVGAGAGRQLQQLEAPPLAASAPAPDAHFVPIAWGP